jgi:hypothetical protein
MNINERADFYKILSNNVMIRYLTIYNNDDLTSLIESNKVIPNNLDNVEVLIGFLIDNRTSIPSRLCFYSEITIGEIEDENNLIVPNSAPLNENKSVFEVNL